jgi:hypothetical protein
MNTNQTPELASPLFLKTVSLAVGQLKRQLQRDYEQTYPNLREIIHLVLDEEETNAWNLTLFPHLLLPDLVESHIARLNLQPANTRHDDVVAPHHFNVFENHEPAFALCG